VGACSSISGDRGGEGIIVLKCSRGGGTGVKGERGIAGEAGIERLLVIVGVEEKGRPSDGGRLRGISIVFLFPDSYKQMQCLTVT
jgi:hypothetical protein